MLQTRVDEHELLSTRVQADFVKTRAIHKRLPGSLLLLLVALLLSGQSASAQFVNGNFTTGDLTGWTQTGFRDSSPSLFNSVLPYGATPSLATFQTAQSTGITAPASNGVVAQQANNFDGNGPFASSTAITAPSGTPIGFITNHNANAGTNGNMLVGSSIFQTFFVPSDATHITFFARQLSNEGLDTASSSGGQTVGADFGGIALHSGNTLFGQYVFDEQSDSAANFHVANFSADGSTGFGGFVSGTDWQSLAFDVTGLRGQNVTLTAFEVNTGDTNFESRLLLADVVLQSATVAPEAGTFMLVALGCSLVVGAGHLRRRMRRTSSPR